MKLVIISEADECALARAYDAAKGVFDGVGASPLQSQLADWRIEYAKTEVSLREGEIGYAWLQALAAVGDVLGDQWGGMRVEASREEFVDAMREMGVSEEGANELLLENGLQ